MSSSLPGQNLKLRSEPQSDLKLRSEPQSDVKEMRTAINHYDIKEELGSGGYGKVYRAYTRTGESVAIKKIPIKEEGIPCLLEATIMASIKHPNINHASQIFTCTKCLNIVQEEALSDLAKHTRRKITPLSTVRRWAHQISSAVLVFHRLGFVHADIKASNILYFTGQSSAARQDKGDYVKLSDYTLIAKMWHPKDKFMSSAGTNTHSAPEVLLGQLWNRSIDIWSLACTFYQMAFGKYLFNLQDRGDSPNGSKRCKVSYHNAIAAFFNMRDHLSANVSFVPCDNESLLYTAEYALFHDLIFKMLRYNPDDRINIEQVINHPFFTGLVRIPPTIVHGKVGNISGKKLETVSGIILRMLRGCVEYYTVQEITYMNEIAVETYKRVQALDKSKVLREVVLAGCCLIGAKIVLGRLGAEFRLNTEVSMDRMYNMEGEICVYLSYCIPIGFNEMVLD